MFKVINFYTVFFYCAAVVYSSACFGKTDLLPVEYFAELPDVQGVRISPDGKTLFSIIRVETETVSGRAIQVANIKSGKKELVFFTSNEKEVIRWASWGNNSKLLVSISFPATRGGTSTNETRLLVVDIKTKNVRNAISNQFLKSLFYYPQFQDDVIDMLPDDPDHFLLQISTGTNLDDRVYKVSLKNRKMTLVQRSQPDVRGWVTDRQGNVRIATRIRDAKYTIMHRFPGEKDWNVLWEFEVFTEDEVWPIGFDHDSNILYVEADYNGRQAIYSVDVSDEKLKKKLIYKNDKYDIDGSLIYSNLSKKVVGITLSDAEDYLYWDERRTKFMEKINKSLPDTDNRLVSMSDDENMYVLYSSSSNDPGVYYLGDRKRNRLDPIAERYIRLPLKILSEKKPITYKARDGLEIEGFLTLPLGRKESESVPTIIFPHGGPISYDGTGFDYWTQFFANRGYAVLQMNFRGSYGYGYDFMQMGLANWGRAMQDDVEDGARWMVKKGYADPQKLCIVGASYGGYAALMGAIKSPDLYKCVISFAGVTDIHSLLIFKRQFDQYEITKRQLGDDGSSLRSRSPLRNAASIRAPVLLIHGYKDRRVKVSHSKRMYNALKKENKEVTYIELENGRHFLGNNDNRVRTFKAMDEFLGKYLPVER